MAVKDTTLYQQLYDWKWRERLIHRGNEFPDRTFYIIRRHASQAGLFSFVATNLGSMKMAFSSGYTPIIDMQNSTNPMLRRDEIGIVNAWDLFFEQPCGIGLDDIKNAENVILGSILPPANEEYPDYNMLSNIDEFNMWRTLAGKYLRILPIHRSCIDEYCNDNFSGRRILGVLCRGTDYILKKPYNHPIQPEIDDIVSKCRSVMTEHKCDLIYLATEDLNIWNRFISEIPGKVISFQKEHLVVEPGETINDVGNSNQDPYDRNRIYLISIGILARCNCLVAGAAGGSYGALLMTEGYDYSYVFQLGRYR